MNSIKRWTCEINGVGRAAIRIVSIASCALVAGGAASPGVATSGPQADPPTMAKAESLMRSGRYADAAEVFERVVALDPDNGVAQVRYGRALLEAGQADKAIVVENNAAEIAAVKPRALFHLACGYAAKGDNALAVECVERAVAAGLANEQVLLIEPRLASLRDDPRFKAAVDRIRAANDRPIFHALDFWVGDWDVYDAQANRIGTNRIDSQESGCVIAETWRGTAGDSGRSMNFYVPESSVWRQVWVNHVGDVLTMDGHAVDGAMWFEGESRSRRGGARQNRTVLTALPGGRVRQTIHVRSGAEAPWELAFDGVYVARGSAFAPEQFPEQPPPGKD